MISDKSEIIENVVADIGLQSIKCRASSTTTQWRIES